MKIAWLTPFSRKSAIGRFSQAVVTALAKLSQVEIVTFGKGEMFDIDVPVRRFPSAQSVDEHFFARYDIAAFNFGNYIPFHKEIYEVSRRWHGIAILHDFVMHHFFAGYYLEQIKSPAEYINAVERIYGEPGRDAAAASLTGRDRVWETDRVTNFPMFEGAMEGCEGVITHSEFFRRRVEDSFAGPVRRIPLAYTVDRASPVLSRRDLGLAEGIPVILTIGHINPNKRVTAVIEALAALHSRVGPVQYVLAGLCSSDYRKDVERAIKHHHLQHSVTIAGEVSDLHLRSYLSSADVCVNLRYPATEGASASAIEEMLFGKPLIVGKVGFYAELPDECVVKVDPTSVPELRDAFERLLENPEERRRMGQAAQAHADKEFHPEAYAREVISFADEVRRARPVFAVTDRLARDCRRMGVTAGMPIVDTLADELGALFGGKPK